MVECLNYVLNDIDKSNELTNLITSIFTFINNGSDIINFYDLSVISFVCDSFSYKQFINIFNG